ncbi:MAG: glycine-rich domain-containing protein-like [Deltaproteobacteria bacterium]|nr:glycine-rich domain-containing protein-like [Deltaproteobacteria bacterium]
MLTQTHSPQLLLCAHNHGCPDCEAPIVEERSERITQLPELSIDLVTASYRAGTFPQDWSHERRVLEARRYRMFLALAAHHPGKYATPTREIDEFWHLHMLNPVAYYEDCQKIFGRIFDHDGGFGTGPGELAILKAAFRDFALRWGDAYGEAYVEGFLLDGLVDCWHDCVDRCWHACKG